MGTWAGRIQACGIDKIRKSKEVTSSETRKKMSEAQKGKVRSPEAIEKQKATYRSNKKHPWEHHLAFAEIWAIADKIYAAISPLGFVENSSAIISTVGFYDKSKMGGIIKKIKKGWNPLSDDDYLIWKMKVVNES